MILNTVLTPHVFNGIRKIKVETVGHFPWFKGPYEIEADNAFFDFLNVEELYKKGMPMTHQVDKEWLLSYQNSLNN